MAEFTPEQLKTIQGWLDKNDQPWLRAAKKALAGDLTELRERVELLTTEPMVHIRYEGLANPAMHPNDRPHRHG